MDFSKQDTLMFFDNHPTAVPLYEAFEAKLLEIFPLTTIRVQKTQITFSNRHVYACVSFQRVRKKRICQIRISLLHLDCLIRWSLTVLL